MTVTFMRESRKYFDQADDMTKRSARPVLEFLSTGFEVSWFREQSRGLWQALLKPTRSVSEQFALEGEYFIVGNGFPNDFHQRTLLAEPPSEVSSRIIDPKIRFVASPAPNMRDLSAAWALERRMAIVPIEIGASRDPNAMSGGGSLPQLLSKSLWRRDVFDDSEPIVDPAEFFGRAVQVRHIISRAVTGQPTAVFGLRKIGKSSLLRRVQQSLMADSSAVTLTAFLQCNATKIRAGRWWDALEVMLKEWSDALSEVARKHSSRISVGGLKLVTLARSGTPPKDAVVGRAFEDDVGKLVRAGQQLARETGKEAGCRLVVFVDEVDAIYPKTGMADFWMEDYFSMWDTLQTTKRGLDTPTHLVYLLGGVNPIAVEAGTMFRRPNPLFEMGTLYLPPFPAEESGALIAGLGSRVGLTFLESAREKAFRLTGGHPWLLRRLGSQVHLAFPERGSRKEISASAVERVFQRNRRAFYAHIDWIMDYLRQVAPEECRLLRDIAVGGEDAYISEWSNVGFREVFANHLAQYGLVEFDPDSDMPRIAMDLVRETLTHPQPSSRDDQRRQLVEMVEMLESYIRSRIALDVSYNRSLPEAVEEIVTAIPESARNRPRDRNQLRNLGLGAGIRPLMDDLNWGDYLSILDRHYDLIRWSGRDVPKSERIEIIRGVVKCAHVVRHNNSNELSSIVDERGFDTVYRSFREVLEMFTT